MCEATGVMVGILLTLGLLLSDQFEKRPSDLVPQRQLQGLLQILIIIIGGYPLVMSLLNVHVYELTMIVTQSV